MYQQPMAIPSMQGGVGSVGVGGNNQVVGGNNLVFSNLPQQLPIHPDVRLKRLAFYDIKGVLIQPSSLVPQGTNRTQEAVYHFTLTPQQATEIASNRDIRNGNKLEYTVQVQLRFCLMETSCEQEDCFPPNVIVKVNNKMCPLPNPIPTNRPNVEAKRPPRPVNVTTNVKLSPTVTNSVSVQWSSDYSRGYVLSAYLVKKLTSTELLNRMRAKGVKSADFTRALIKEKLREDGDCEIATTMLKVSLMCPLGKMKMSIPCRSSTCSHLQCFDANLYLQMNERKPTWICPVCDKPAVYDNLVIDGYFQEVLATNQIDTEIQLHKDGSWSTHVNKTEATVLDTPIKPLNKVEIICDDLELIPDVKVTSNSHKQEPSSSSNPSEPTSSAQGVCVDLTLSDSDDDLPLKRRGPTSQANKNGNKISSTSSSKAKSGMDNNFVDYF
ncbi:PIAS1 family protein [Megaselia abdita]